MAFCMSRLSWYAFGSQAPGAPLHTAFGLDASDVPWIPALAERCLSGGGARQSLRGGCHHLVGRHRGARNVRQKDATLAALHRELQGLARAAEAERVALSEWLRQDVSLELTMVDWRLNHLTHQVRRGVAIQSEALILRRAISERVSPFTARCFGWAKPGKACLACRPSTYSPTRSSVVTSSSVSTMVNCRLSTGTPESFPSPSI